jgi:hypothetical protein
MFLVMIALALAEVHALAHPTLGSIGICFVVSGVSGVACWVLLERAARLHEREQSPAYVAPLPSAVARRRMRR